MTPPGSGGAALLRQALGAGVLLLLFLPLSLVPAQQSDVSGQPEAASSSSPATPSETGGGLFGKGAAQSAPPEPLNLTTAFVKMFVALLVVLGLVVGLALLLRRVSARLQTLGGGVVSVLAQVPLGPSQFLTVVDIGGEILVLGVTEHSVNALTEIQDPAVIERLRREGPAVRRPGALLPGVPSFRQWLQKAQQGELDG
jgi:flagellar protein FliO/FliZ